MQPENIPPSLPNGNVPEDRATAVMLANGAGGGAPAFVLRHWRSDGSSTDPVFVARLLDVGRFCLTVKYGRYSPRHGEWYIATG